MDQPHVADVAGSAPAHQGGEANAPGAGQRGTESLLQLAAKSRKEKPEETDAEKALKEEQELLKATTKQKALQGVQELARVSTTQSPALRSDFGRHYRRRLRYWRCWCLRCIDLHRVHLNRRVRVPCAMCSASW